MCGRYALRSSTPKLARALGVESYSGDEVYDPSYNIAPTRPVLTCRADHHGRRQFAQMRWGLIPNWSKGDSSKFNMINARADTITERPAYRTPFRFRRCLIPADGFYEWQRQGTRKQPYFIRLRSAEPFAFAGVWERWNPKDAGSVESCAIITTDANEVLASIHHRMPVILPAERYGAWLDPNVTDADQLTPMLEPFDPHEMEAYPVSTYVNKAANDDERCWQPIGADQP